METLIINTSKTDKGYSCACDKMQGWVCAFTGDFEQFRQYVQESIDFWLDCQRADGCKCDPVFDGEYTLLFKFDVQSLLYSYRDIFSYSAMERITGINQKQLQHYATGLKKPRQQQARRIASGLCRLASELNAITV